MKSPQDAGRITALAGLAKWDPGLRRRTFLLFCLLPALVVLFFVLVYPLIYNVFLSFSDASSERLRDWRFTGFRQYLEVFRSWDFWTVFGKTMVWTAASTGLQVVIGVTLALIIHQRFLRGRSAWSLLLMLPWAIPQYITALTWRGMFQGEHGPVNTFLSAAFGWTAVDWLNSSPLAFTTAILVNVWMGFPFMMIIALAGLQQIPETVYEAARLDGANSWTQLRRLTLPLLRPVMLPATVIGIVWNFNSLNVIWLFSDGGAPHDSTHILVSYVYKAAFTYQQFGWAAALSVVVFVILFLFVQAFLQINDRRR